jgi:hypothetical protein
LEGLVFDERLLERVQTPPVSETLNRLDLLPVDLDPQYQAGIDQAAVQEDRAGPAIPVVTAFLGAGESEDVPQAFEDALTGITQEIDRVAVNRGPHAHLFTTVAMVH